MFEKQIRQELDFPPIAKSNPRAVEVLRVWAVPGQPQELTLKTTWRDPGAWGLLLADVAHHAAKAYENQGYSYNEAIARIKLLLDTEVVSSSREPAKPQM